METVNPIIGLLDGLRPTSLKTVSEWANENVFLSSESSAEPGRYSWERTPYVQEIADCLSPNSLVIDVTVMKGVQLGLTATGLNVVGAFMDLSPCPIMYVMPTLDTAKEISDGRVTPMIENSPALSKIVKPQRERDGGNTKLLKKFRGGRLVMAGANSAASLRSRAIRVLILDEVDAYPLNVDEEGSPVSLAEKRTSTFGLKKKIFRISTPLIQATSVVEKKFLETDQRYYHVPCPHCAAFQHLKFPNLKFDRDEAGNPINVAYECEHCHELIEERFKTIMLAEGHWIATAPAKVSPTRRGYHINSLYSPMGWLSWADIVKEFLDAGKDQDLLRAFVNTILGETWAEKGEAPDWEKLHLRSQVNPYPFNVPPVPVCFMTAGVDVQKDRLEVEVVGWAKNKVSYSICYHQLIGPTEEQKVWNDLAAIVDSTFEREDGVQLRINMTAIDTQYNGTFVYEFCRRYDETRVIPIQGRDNLRTVVTHPKLVDHNSDGKKIGIMKLWGVGVSMLKSELYAWLRLKPNEDGTLPHGYCNFPQYNAEYFKGLTAESLQYKIVNRAKRYMWVKDYERNEPLDCRNYARAAAAVVGMDLFQDEDYDNMIEDTEPEKPTPRRSSFWDRD